jgi:hypothetical protein
MPYQSQPGILLMFTITKPITTAAGSRLSRLLADALVLGLLLCGCVPPGQGPATMASPSGPIAGLSPAKALSPTSSLIPGLTVLYFIDIFAGHIDQLPSGKAATQKGKPGKPILFLDHNFSNQSVFDSGKKSGVGLELNGLIRLSPAGSYRFKALSNDGIRVYIGGHMVLDDPDVHGERFCGPSTVTVDQEGWYDLKVRYFQRKGSAALSLQWQPPGQQDFTPVPAEAYRHNRIE